LILLAWCAGLGWLAGGGMLAGSVPQAAACAWSRRRPGAARGGRLRGGHRCWPRPRAGAGRGCGRCGGPGV